MNNKDSHLIFEAYQEGHTEIIAVHQDKIQDILNAISETHPGKIIDEKLVKGLLGEYARPFMRIDVTGQDKTRPVITLYPAGNGSLMSVAESPDSNKIHWFYFWGVSPEKVSDTVTTVLGMGE